MHPNLVNSWIRKFLSKTLVVSSDKPNLPDKQQEADTEKIYAHIGHLKVENNYLKKAIVKPSEQRMQMIEKDNKHLSTCLQCDLLDIHHSGL